MINYHIKGLDKITCYKTESNFSRVFFSHWLLHKCFFLFLIKAFVNFEKLIRFHWLAFTVYKNGDNLKMLIEIFCQKLLVSNVILAFLDYLKSKDFFVGQPWWTTLSATTFQNLWIRPCLASSWKFQPFQRYINRVEYIWCSFFCENRYWVFRKKAPSQMVDWVVNTSLLLL